MAKNGFSINGGKYNPDWYPHLQIMMRPQNDAVPIDAIRVFQKYRPNAATRAFCKAVKNRRHEQHVWEEIGINQSDIWTLCRMGRAEYERGGFESALTHTLVHHTMAAGYADLDFNQECLPSQGTVAEIRGFCGNYIPETHRADMAEKGIDLPPSVRARVWIIAPKERWSAAADFLHRTASAGQEPDTHVGFGINSSVAQQILTDAERAHLEQPREKDCVGWFDIHAGVFMTIDEKMFERAHKAFDVEGTLRAYRVVLMPWRPYDRKPFQPPASAPAKAGSETPVATQDAVELLPRIVLKRAPAPRP